MPEPQKVVHVEADYNEEKVEDVKVEEVDAAIDGKTAEFESKSFSIYAFVQTKILTVKLYNG